MRWIKQGSRWICHWIPFTLLTVFYGCISLLLGPLSRERRVSHWAMRAWCRSGLRFLRIGIDLKGLGNVPRGPLVYASNHQSLLDTLVLGATLPGDVKWAVKSSVMAIPILGWHLWLAGHVRVDRGGDRNATLSTIDRFTQVLLGGRRLLVFAEGTRSRDGRVQPFKKGPFYSAVRANAPVVPVALHGTGAVMAKGARDMVSASSRQGEARSVYVRVGQPVRHRADDPESTSAADLRDRTRAAVIEMYCALAAAEHSRAGDGEERLTVLPTRG